MQPRERERYNKGKDRNSKMYVAARKTVMMSNELPHCPSKEITRQIQEKATLQDVQRLTGTKRDEQIYKNKHC